MLSLLPRPYRTPGNTDCSHVNPRKVQKDITWIRFKLLQLTFCLEMGIIMFTKSHFFYLLLWKSTVCQLISEKFLLFILFNNSAPLFLPDWNSNTSTTREILQPKGVFSLKDCALVTLVRFCREKQERMGGGEKEEVKKGRRRRT